MFLDLFGGVVINLYYQIFSWVSNLYGFIFDLTNTASFFDAAYINSIWKTLYSIVGIFMLFRIVISMLQYLVDPDKLTDKSVGGGKLASRIVISIVLVLIMPFIFDFLQDVQGVIIGNDGLLSNFAKSISNGNEDNSYGGASTSYYDKNEDGVFTKVLSKGFSLIVPEVKAESICNNVDDMYKFLNDMGNTVEDCESNIYNWKDNKSCVIGVYYTELYKQSSSVIGSCKFENENDVYNKMKNIISEALKKLSGDEENLFCNYFYQPTLFHGPICNNDVASPRITWYGLNNFKGKLNNSDANYGLCKSDDDQNCFSIYTIVAYTDSQEEKGTIKDIVLKRRCISVDDNDSLGGSGNFNDCRLDFYITYYDNNVFSSEQTCYYGYVGTSGTGTDGYSMVSAPFLTYAKIKFKGVSDGYMNIEFLTDSKVLTDAKTGKPLSTSLNEIVFQYMDEKGSNQRYTNKNFTGFVNSLGTTLYAKSATCSKDSSNCTQMSYDKDDLNNIYNLFKNGNCPWIVVNGNGGFECKIENNAYGQGDNYTEPASYVCTINNKDKLKLTTSAEKKISVPSLTCPSKTYDEMMSCMRKDVLSDYGVESSFSPFYPEVYEKLLSHEKEKLLNEWDKFNITDVSKSEIAELLGVKIDEKVTEVKASKEELDEFRKANKRGNQAADSFAGLLMVAFVDIVNSDAVTAEEMYCLKAENILHGKYKGSESCKGIIVDGDDDEHIYVSAFIGLIMGIIVIVLLATLAVDVVIRNAKLLLLQIISPVAILSFINPRDKIFPQWVKMYGATFADLFIKLLAIMLIPIILAIFNIGNQDSNMIKIFMILGILAFAKAAPAFISKVFGISDMAGSFKDAGNMLKAAAFGTAGAGLAVGSSVIGAGRNAYSAYKGGLGGKGAVGAALRGLSGTAGAALRGFGAGTKGNVMAGAKGSWATASSRNALYQQGVGAGSQMINGIGLLNYANKVDRDNAKLESENQELEEFNKHKKNMESIADSSGFMQTIQNGMSTGKLNITNDQYKAIRDKYIESSLKNGGSVNTSDLRSIVTDDNGNQVLTDKDLNDIGLAGKDSSGNYVSKVATDFGTSVALKNELDTAANDVKGSKLLSSMISSTGGDLSSFTKLKDFSKSTKSREANNKVAIASTHDDKYKAADKVRKSQKSS